MLSTKPSFLALMGLGFSKPEAQVYVVLAKQPASTGYRISQLLGKAAAGTYKALESLLLKGAVVVDEGETRIWRAVPPDELLGQIDRSYARRRQAAKTALADLKPAADDERIYRLYDFLQVIERVTQILDRAETVVMADLFPPCLPFIKEALEKTCARGVSVYVKLYEPACLEVTNVIVTDDKQHILDVWKADWLNVVVDAKEHLLSLLDCRTRSVHQAIWTDSMYLSTLYHGGIRAELQIDALHEAIAEGRNLKALRALCAHHHQAFPSEPPPGVREILASLRSG